jgi:hypothetical protein
MTWGLPAIRGAAGLSKCSATWSLATQSRRVEGSGEPERLIPPRLPLLPVRRACVRGRAVSCMSDCPKTGTPPP